jgi:hypothetical protein
MRLYLKTEAKAKLNHRRDIAQTARHKPIGAIQVNRADAANDKDIEFDCKTRYILQPLGEGCCLWTYPIVGGLYGAIDSASNKGGIGRVGRNSQLRLVHAMPSVRLS